MKNLLILILLFLSVTLRAQEKQLTDEEKIFGLSLIWQEVNYNFAYLDNYNLDWDSLYVANIPKVVAAKNLTDYYSILSNIINYFHEAHTTVDLPKAVQQHYGRVPIELIYINGKYYVTGFSPEYKNKISIGSILFSVNNYSPDIYYEKFVYPNNNIAKHCAKRFLSRRQFFNGLLSKELTATFLNTDGKKVTLELRRKPFDNNESKKIEVPKMYEDTIFLYKKYDDISYIRIGSFLNNKPSTLFSEIIDSLKNCKAIIFDVRDNFGGSSQYATEIIKNFSDKKSIKLWWGKSKVNNSNFRAFGMYSYTKDDTAIKEYNNYYADYASLSHYEGGQYNFSNQTKGELKGMPVIVLCNYKTVSSAEAFIVQLKQVTSVTVIGEPTCGSITTPLIVPLPGGGTVWIGAQKAFDENGKPYKYIQPDITHIPSLEDEMMGADGVLKIAIDYVNNRN
jgi:hypothetical protein